MKEDGSRRFERADGRDDDGTVEEIWAKYECRGKSASKGWTEEEVIIKYTGAWSVG